MRRTVIFASLVLTLLLLIWGCGGSAFKTGAKVALQENPPGYDRAEQNLMKAMDQTPDDYEIYQLLAEVYFRRPKAGPDRKNDYENAEEYFAKAAELAPPEKQTDIAQSRFYIAQKLMTEQKFDAALKVIEDVEVTWEAEPGEYYNVGLLYLTLSREAADNNDQAMSDEYKDKALAAFQKGVDQVQGTLDKFMAKAQRDPDSEKELKAIAGQLYSGLGNAYIAKNDLEGATDAYNKAVEYAPENKTYQADLQSLHAAAGQELIEEGKCDEAIAFYQGLLEGDPENVDLLFYLGKAYLCKDDMDNAVATFEKGVALAPDDNELLNEVVNVYIKAQNFDAAKEYMLKLKANLPDQPEVLFNMGQICSYAKDYECVIENMKEYLNLIEDDDCDAHDFIAAAQRNLGNEEEADIEAKKAADCRANQ